MRKLISILCFFTGVLLLIVKLTAILVDPSTVSTGIFTQLIVVIVACALICVGWRVRNVSRKGSELRWYYLLLLLVGLTMTGFILMTVWVDNGLKQRTCVGVYNEPYKVWATRGLVTDGSDGSPVRVRNSIASISYAFEQGARGTEVDVHYDSAMRRFVVSHGDNYKKQNSTLLTLEALLDAVGDDGYFWLDWKKLRHLNGPQLQAALARLNRLVEHGDLRSRFYVEGEAPLPLLAVKNAGFQTIYDCHPMFDGNIFGPPLVDIFKAVYYFGGFTVMGMNSGTWSQPIYGPNTRRLLRNIPVFLYHLPDDVKFPKELVSCRNVRVVIIRQDINRFNFMIDSSAASSGS